METFTWLVDDGATPELEMRNKETQLGNGLSQVVPDGLNPVREIWQITRFGLLSEVKPAYDFLKAKGGHTTFLWTSPFGDTILVRATDISMPHSGGDTYTLRAKFTQQFRP